MLNPLKNRSSSHQKEQRPLPTTRKRASFEERIKKGSHTGQLMAAACLNIHAITNTQAQRTSDSLILLFPLGLRVSSCASFKPYSSENSHKLPNTTISSLLPKSRKGKAALHAFYCVTRFASSIAGLPSP
jgi:hypothetical protein